MAIIDETRLKAQIKSGQLACVYFLFGEEIFLTKMYEKKLIEAAVGKEPLDFNLIKLSGNPPAQELSDHIEGLPFFSERKCIVISDFDAEKLLADETKQYMPLFADIPESCVLIISVTGYEIDCKKMKAKTKKLIAEIEKRGVVVEFKPLTSIKIGDMIIKKAQKNGCTISIENARLLADMTQKSLTAAGIETDKLCAYIGKGEITRDAINALVPKQVDTSIFTLAAAVVSGNMRTAFHILDDLAAQRIEPNIIAATLSGAFTDFYRARIAIDARKPVPAVTADFAYPPNKSFLVQKAFTAVQSLPTAYLRSCIRTLYRANMKLNSTTSDKKTILEQALVKLAPRR